MPLINGQKMACEPCIRGHRSTKCSHANERLMVPVRRPGRPLSSCPHPPSRPCQCAAVTAAIPKKQKCRCESSAHVVAPNSTASGEKVQEVQEVQQPAPVKAEPSSSRGSGSSETTTLGHRVHKSVSKRSSKKPIDPAALERMDASQLNIVSASDAGFSSSRSDSRSETSGAVAADGAGFGVMQFVSPEAYLAATVSPSNGYAHQTWNGAGTTFKNGQSPQLSNGCETGSQGSTAGQSPGDSDAPKKSPKKSCCGCGASSDSETFTKAPEPASASALSHATPHTTTPTPTPTPTHSLDHYQMNGGIMSSLPVPMAMPHGIFPYVPHQSVFAYPPQYGSFLQPLQPEQWRHLTSNMNTAPGYSVPVPVPGASTYTSAPHAGPGIVPVGPANHLGGSSSWTSHQCGCGDSCQCVGCASHPYNEATQNYVRSAWAMMMEETPKQLEATVHEPSNHNHGEGHTPGGGEEQSLSANDFFFVSYPFRNCEGEMASCPCGEDCACEGCAIHGSA